MAIEPRQIRRWVAATAFALAAACGSRPNGPDPPPTSTAPQIACPADMTVRSVMGSAQEVAFSAPTVTGGAAPVNVSCNPASGASFPLGTTPVSCAATDAQTRQATCSFNVSLTGFAIAVTKYDALGDSLTEGQNGRLAVRFVDLPNAYPTKLQLLFDLNYPGQGISVINHGQGGQKIDVISASLRGFLAADRPGAVLLLGGYNNLTDVCPPGSAVSTACGTATTDVAGGIRDCIRHSKEAPQSVPYVFVSTLTPPGPSGPRRINNDAILQVNSRIRQVVAQEGAILVDVYPLFQGHEADYVDTDGLHLRPAGYQTIADAFFASIKATIPQTPLAAINGWR